MLLLGGGLVGYKLMSGKDPAPTPPVPSAPTTTVTRPSLVDAPPPPPTDEVPSAAPSASTAKTAIPTGGGCAASCSGTASGALSGEVQGRAGRARGCYERALRNNSTLQGKMSVNITVDSSGNVCAASTSGDTVGSPEVSSCVLGMFRGQKLPAPTGGCVQMRIPLNFQPKQ